MSENVATTQDDPPDDSHDSDDSDDSDEVLDQAPDLHLSVPEKIKLLLLLATKKRHKLTYAAAEDVIDLAGVFSGGSPFLPSKHIMKSAIEKYSFGLEEHHVCPNGKCGKYIGIVTVKTFQCSGCHRKTDVEENKTNGSMFLYLPLKEQLKALLESLPEHVQLDPKGRTKIEKFNYEDIQDGAIYKLISSNTITINFFIDGLQVRIVFICFLSCEISFYEAAFNSPFLSLPRLHQQANSPPGQF